MSSKLKPEQCDAMRTLLKSARLLYVNMVGCCENHHQIDHAQQGLPGWLIDCLRDIELAGPAIDTLESTVSAQAAEIERLREALNETKTEIAREWKERRMAYSVMPMLITESGQGPATIGVDAVGIVWEVWDQSTMSSVSSHEFIADAIADAIARAVLQGEER